MFAWLANLVWPCWGPLYACIQNDNEEEDDPPSTQDTLMWHRNHERHSSGQFSFAVIHANQEMEDYSQVETGLNAIFVGVYDGHGGHEASRYARDHLFQNLTEIASARRTMSEEIIRQAFAATETGFMTIVSRGFGMVESIATVGSCCLVGIIWRETLYIAQLGDSRAVLGTVGCCNKITAEQLTTEHNASREEIRQELMALHPADPNIVIFTRGAWRVRGIIQVSRAIGDAYLKRPEYDVGDRLPRFRLAQPINRAVMSAEPSIITRALQPNDRFLIFASDGLWEYLTNQRAAEIVHWHRRPGIARKLVRTALKEAAKKANMEYSALKDIGRGDRRPFHDDISVVVVFIDHEMLGRRANADAPQLSYRAFVDSTGPSNFTTLQNLM